MSEFIRSASKNKRSLVRCSLRQKVSTSRLNCPDCMSGCHRVLGRLFQTCSPSTQNFCRPVKYWTSGRYRRWRWQNKDDSAQGRWRWAGIPGPGTAALGPAVTLQVRPNLCRYFLTVPLQFILSHIREPSSTVCAVMVIHMQYNTIRSFIVQSVQL